MIAPEIVIWHVPSTQMPYRWKQGFAVKPFNLLWPEPHCIIGKNRALAAQTDRVPFFSVGVTYNAFFVKMRKSVIEIQALP